MKKTQKDRVSGQTFKATDRASTLGLDNFGKVYALSSIDGYQVLSHYYNQL